MSVRIGEHEAIAPVLVATLSHAGILGMSFLSLINCLIDTKNGKLIIGEDTFDCHLRVAKPFICRLVVKRATEIPPGCEMIIPTRMSRKPGRGQAGYTEGADSAVKTRMSVIHSTCFEVRDTSGTVNEPKVLAVVEPVKRTALLEKGVVACKTLVNPRESCLPVRVFNVSEAPVKVHSGEVIGLLRVESGKGSEIKPAPSEPAFSDILHVKDDCKVINNESQHVPEHLTELYKQSCKHLNHYQQVKVATMLKEYQDVFSSSDHDIGRTNIIQHKIVTGNAPPTRQAPYRTPIWKRDEIDKQVKGLLERGLIEESVSPWAAPCVLVGKKDGSQRLYIDYRKLNSVSIKGVYPIPSNDSLDALHGAVWFSTLDLHSGYWQVELEKAQRRKLLLLPGMVCISGMFSHLVFVMDLVCLRD
ncbi:uncharacterized protein [Ptychodera flava]|uniref:uncharacterized protein n=1 Tax=Ptychodera flava TaxID=63121 RepID=UPI00396A3F41